MRNTFLLLFVVLTNILIFNTLSAQKTWVGNTSYNWATGTSANNNWNTIGAPIANDNVIANVVFPKLCHISTAVSRSGTTTLSGSGLTIKSASGVLTNTGAMTANAAIVIESNGTLTNNSGGTMIYNTFDGALSVQSSVANNNTGASMTFSNSASIYIEGGTFNNSGGTLNLNAALVWIGTGGTFNNTGTINNTGSFVGGDGTFSGSLFTNPSGSTIGLDGYIATCLTFSNGLSNAGTVLFQINGPTACAQRDNITVTGAMTFGGTFTASGSPEDGTYTLMTYGSRTGTFTNTSAVLTNGKILNIRASEYGANTLIGIVSATVLPIELTRFEGNKRKGHNLLTWQTASETQNKGFDIERSTDGVRFESIGFVAGSGTVTTTQSYTFEDMTPIKGVSYYRLKQLDFDGRFEYSNIISITQNGKNEVSVFPNPSNGVFTITGVEDTEEDKTFVLTNSIGQTVSVKVQNNGQVDMSAYPSGVYFLHIGSTSSGQVIRMMKE